MDIIPTINFQVSVLIIENNLDDLKMLGTFLKQQNYDVLFATTSEQALKITKSKLPDIILSNVLVSDAKSFEFCKALKESKTTANIPILFMLSPTNSETLTHFFNECKNDFVYKPINNFELLHRIKIQLEIATLKKATVAVKNIIESKLIPFFDLVSEHAKTTNNIDLAAQSKELKNSISAPLKNTQSLPVTTTSKKTEANLSSQINTKKILVVEDNELNQELIDSILTEAGYTIVISGTGAEAIAEMKKQQPDVILLDMNLPDMACADVYNEFVALGNTAPIIAVSGYTKAEIQKINPTIPFNDYLLKPVNAEELIFNIEKHISSTKNNNVIAAKEYDYSKAKKIAAGSNEELKKWMNEFIAFLKSGKGEIEAIVENKIKIANRDITHGILNYTVFFGADDLKNLIMELKSVEKNESTKPSSQLLEDILAETNSLLNYYEKTEASIE